MDINIAFGVTTSWLRYTLVTICSILSNASEDDNYKFYIMCDNEIANFGFMCECFNMIKPAEYQFIKMDESWFEGAIHDWLGVSSSYRLKLPSLVNEDKVLYLDSDIIVFEDIAELYSKDVSNYYLAAVEDKLSSIMAERVNLKDNEVFVNGGVQLLNLEMFRKHDLESKIFEKLRNSDFYTDQDVINDICRDKILQLPLRYNLMPILDDEDVYINRREEFLDALAHPFVLHFTEKPWKDKNINYAEYWYMYANILAELINKKREQK